MSIMPAKAVTRDMLADALDVALAAFDLTITPRYRDEDAPDWDDVTAVADRIYDNLNLDDQEEGK